MTVVHVSHGRLIIKPKLQSRAAAPVGRVPLRPGAIPAVIRNAEQIIQQRIAAQVPLPLAERVVAKPQAFNSIVAAPRIQLQKKQPLKRKGNGPHFITPDVTSLDITRLNNVRNLGLGKLLVIVGNGPSLSEISPEPLRTEPGVDIMSVNKPDGRLWPTTYWTFFDRSQYLRNQASWDEFTGYIFNSTSIQHRKPSCVQLKTLIGQGFAMDLTQGVYIGRSSVYASMQLALWLGYDHIYILGCDMQAVDGKLHFYGVNPDVAPETREGNFVREAIFYQEAANSLPEDIRSRFTFCSSYNKYPFVDRFNRLDHRIAVHEICAHARKTCNEKRAPAA